MEERLTYVSDLFKGGGYHFGGDINVLNNFDPDDPSTQAGLLDSVGDQYASHGHLWGQVVALHNQVGFGKTASSSFQGLIYTNGYFYADQEVNVVGAVMADDDGTQQSVTRDNQTVNPGDIFLNNGTSLTFNKAYFDEAQSQTNIGPLTLTSWVPR